MYEKGYWKKWFAAAGIRALKTFFQAGVAAIGTARLVGEVNWLYVVSSAGLAAIISLGTSLAGLPEVEVTEEDKAA